MCGEDNYDLWECDCGRCVCEGCQTECRGCDEVSCHDCTSNTCYICDEEYCDNYVYGEYCHGCFKACHDNYVDGEYCHGCFKACQLAVAWCCKNAQKTHNVLLEDVVERLVVIPRDDGEIFAKRRRFSFY